MILPLPVREGFEIYNHDMVIDKRTEGRAVAHGGSDMIYNKPNASKISELNAEIGTLRTQLTAAQQQAAYWEQMYNEKTFDFSGANVTVDDLEYGIYAWDAYGQLITGKPAGEYGSDRISGTLTKGSYVRFDGIDWIIANVSGSTYTLMKKVISETTEFGSSNTYSGSTIASKCTTFQNAMSANALSVVNSKTVQSVTAKVWIAQKTDIASWTDSNDPTSSDWSGIRKWTGSSEDDYAVKNIYNYWCSDCPYSSSYVWRILYDGYFSSHTPGATSGFRPCIEVVQ